MKKTLITLILFILLKSIYSQDHSKKHLHDDLGFANTIVYDMNESNAHWGLHFHYIKGLNESWSLGVGYETIFADSQHHTTTLIAKYHFCDVFSINAGPGLTFPSKENNNFNLTAHFEFVSIFELNSIHLGPILGFGIGKDEKHISLGLHIGFEL